MNPQTPVQRAKMKMFNAIYHLTSARGQDAKRWLDLDAIMRRAIGQFERALRAEERKPR